MLLDTPFTRGFAAGALVVATLGFFGARHLNEKIARFEEATAVAEAKTAAAKVESERLRDSVTTLRAGIDRTLDSNRVLRAEIERGKRVTAGLVARLASLDAAVQADSACWQLCRPSIVARDTIIAQTADQRDKALIGLQRADSLLFRSDSLLGASQGVIAQKDSALAAYEHAVDIAPTHSTFWSKLKPDVGIGGWAGYDLRFQDWGYGVAFTFDWSLW